MAFQGSLKELPLPDIIQLVSVSGKTGVFVLENDASKGEIYLKDGQIVHARVGELDGEEAIYELAIWPQGNFIFHAGQTPPKATIQRSNTNLLMEAARRIDEWQVLSKRIPSTRLVPVFTDHANTSVSLSPGEWELTTKIDERRSIEEIAIGLGRSPFDVCKVLYGLITSGLVSLNEDLGSLDRDLLQRMTAPEIKALAERVHRQAGELLASHGKSGELENQYRLALAESAAGREVDAVLDLVRSHEKVVSAALGPNQSRAFLDRVGRLFSAS